MDQSDSPSIASFTDSFFHNADHISPPPNAIAIESITDLPAALRRALAPDVVFTPATPGLGFTHRKLPNADIYYVVNSTNQPFQGGIEFRSSHPIIEAWDPDSATILTRNSGNRSYLALAPYESRV